MSSRGSTSTPLSPPMGGPRPSQPRQYQRTARRVSSRRASSLWCNRLASSNLNNNDNSSRGVDVEPTTARRRPRLRHQLHRPQPQPFAVVAEDAANRLCFQNFLLNLAYPICNFPWFQLPIKFYLFYCFIIVLIGLKPNRSLCIPFFLAFKSLRLYQEGLLALFNCFIPRGLPLTECHVSPGLCHHMGLSLFLGFYPTFLLTS